MNVADIVTLELGAGIECGEFLSICCKLISQSCSVIDRNNSFIGSPRFSFFQPAYLDSGCECSDHANAQ